MQNQLLGPDGRPISSFRNKKAEPPKLGTSFGNWAGRDIQFLTLPGGGVVQFDLSKLELSDFRGMRDHYQVNASLAVLSFMQHQSDFHVECSDQKIADFCDEQLHENWTTLNRAMSTANWAGYSPNVIEWDNDYNSRSIVISKIKDLLPEECRVNWKEEEGWAPPGHTKPKFKVYNGIKQFGSPWPVDPDNSFWYPLLMEAGDYYGRKLLKPAFTSWFFSILLHLFANRYYERFGEPVPIGRAPFDDTIDIPNADSVQGNAYMLQLLQSLRSRAAVVLPNSKSQLKEGTYEYDYDIEYLESQMRGADFERYMTRLDEEISIGLFTPILLLRTADVGSYNLGTAHMQVYLWMLNAMNGDRKVYVDKYILSRMVDFNFSTNAPRAKIVFRKLGNVAGDVLQNVLTALINKGIAKPNLEELGQMAGMTLEEITQTIAPDTPPVPAPDGTGDPKNIGSLGETTATVKEIVNRVRGQVESAFRDNRFGPSLQINMGYKHKFERALSADGLDDVISKTNRTYARMDNWLTDVVALGQSEFSSPDSFVNLFKAVLTTEVKELSAA